MSDKYDDTDRHKTHLLVQVEDTVAKLRDSNRELEKTLTELRNTQLALAEAEKKRDEFKGRAQETVRQYVVSLVYINYGCFYRNERLLSCLELTHLLSQ